MQALDAKRLDNIFRMDLKDIGMFAKNTHGSHNPKELLRKALDSEV